MLIVSPPIIDEYVQSILYGEFVEPVKCEMIWLKIIKQIKLVQLLQEYF